MNDLNNTALCLQAITEEEMLRLCNSIPKGPAHASEADGRTTAWAQDVLAFHAWINDVERKLEGMLMDIDAMKRNGDR